MTRIVEGSRCGVSGLNMSISRMRTVAWVMEDVHSHDWQKQVTAQCSPAVIFEKEIRFLLFYLSSVPHCCSAVWFNRTWCPDFPMMAWWSRSSAVVRAALDCSPKIKDPRRKRRGISEESQLAVLM